MSEENKMIARRFREEIWNPGNLAIADEICASDFVWRNLDPLTPDFGPGPTALKQVVTMYRTAFPDVRCTIEDLVAEGDRVVIRWTARGTNNGTLGNLGPTGKTSTVTGIDILRVSGGKIQESWTNWDTLGMFQQLGVSPELAKAKSARPFGRVARSLSGTSRMMKKLLQRAVLRAGGLCPPEESLLFLCFYKCKEGFFVPASQALAGTQNDRRGRRAGAAMTRRRPRGMMRAAKKRRGQEVKKQGSREAKKQRSRNGGIKRNETEASFVPVGTHVLRVAGFVRERAERAGGGGAIVFYGAVDGGHPRPFVRQV